MATQATAVLLVRLNGGSPQSGGIVAAADDTVQLGAQSMAGWGGSPAPRWEILTYAPGWVTPAGWTLDATSGVIYYLGTTPPSFTLPSAAEVTAGMFGVWRFKLTVNGGVRAGLIDKDTTAIELISDNGVRDLAYRERMEFDQQFGVAEKMTTNNRLLDQSVGSILVIGSGTPAVVSSTTGSPGASATTARFDHSHQLRELELRAVTATLAGSLPINSQRITNMAMPVNPADAAPKLYVDALPYKVFVRGASLATQTLSGALTEDGITYLTGDYYLAKDQSTPSQNGVYVVNTVGLWTRHTTMSIDAHLTNGALVGVREGTANASTAWNLTTAAPIVLDTDPLVFTKVWGPNGGTVTSVTGTAPIVVTSNTTTPVVAMAAAAAPTMVTPAINGYMLGVDKEKLNNATSDPTPDTIAMRNVAGYLYAVKMVSSGWYSETSPMTIEMDGGGTFFTFTDTPSITANYNIAAPSFSTNTPSCATSGLLRGNIGQVLVAARNDADTNDANIATWGVDGTDELGIGNTFAYVINLHTKTAGVLRFFDNGTKYVEIDKANGFKFEDGADASMTFAASSVTTGKSTFIEAQGGTNQGGMLALSAGSSATAPGVLRLKTFAPAGTSGEVQFYAAGTQYLGIVNTSSLTTLSSTKKLVVTTNISTTLAPILTSGSATALWAPDRVAKKFTTPNGAPTTALAYALADDTVVLVEARVLAFVTGGNCSVFKLRAGVKRSGGGVATLIGSVDPFAREDDALTDATITVSGNDVQVEVAGIPVTVVHWFVTMDVTLMTP